MKKFRNIFIISFCFISLIIYGCDSTFLIKPPSDAIKTDTNKLKYIYSLPLKVTLDGECDEVKNKIAYEIKEDGTFSYVVDDNTFSESASKMGTRQLSQSETDSIKKLLKELDIALLAEKDTPVKLGEPQTTECRTIENFVLMVNGKEKNFDFNSRTLIHTEQYTTAINKLRSALEQLKKNENSPSQNTYSYSLPLKLILNGECSLGDTNLYEIKEDGLFYYFDDENIVNTSNLKTKQLNKSEIQSLITLLNNLNIAGLAEKDIQSGSVQTEECRTVRNFTMQVNAKSKTFDSNGRKFTHTQEYINALVKVEEKLKELTKDPVSVKYTYSLPLKITDYNECSASIAPRLLYQLSEDGTFTYYIDPSGTISSTITSTNQGSKKLSEQELIDLKNLLKNLNIALLAEKDTKVPAGMLQTADCRNITNFTMQVNDGNRTFDLNGRNLVHTDEYKNALTKLESKLDALKTVNPANIDLNTDLNNSFKLKKTQTAYIKTEDLKVKFVSVVEDSRCPANEMCIWAGQLTIKLNVKKGSQNLGDLDLTLNTDLSLSSKKIDNYVITFENEEPSYIVTLKVTKQAI